jgi:hypothetical protein
MPATPVAATAPLDVLLKSRRIMPGDHRAGCEFAFLAARRSRRFYRPAFVAAVEILDRSGGRAIVEAVVLDGQMPRLNTALARLQDGLGTLYEHFQIEGLL